MSEISVEIGKRIRNFRKAKGMTLEDLAARIHKGKSTVSKYENGEIVVDIETLYEVARVLGIHVEQLLHLSSERMPIRGASDRRPAFFAGLTQYFGYFFDGRSNRLNRCVFEVQSETKEHTYKIMMYVNFQSYDNYQDCETSYYGFMEHYDALTNILLTNQDSPMEKANAYILASYLDGNYKWGIFTGLSARPLMPVAIKMLFTKKPAEENEELIERLKISREDMRLMRMYNMMTIIGDYAQID